MDLLTISLHRIKDETNTRIDLPSETDVSNMIVITGKKEDVDAARFKLLAIQSELVRDRTHNNIAKTHTASSFE